MAKCLCTVLEDHEDWEEPWEDLESAPPEYKKKLEAADSLALIPGLEGGFDTTVRRCPCCGRLYLRRYYFWHFGDRDGLELTRFTPEQTKILGPLLESEDEETLISAMEKAYSSPDKKCGELAGAIYEYHLKWKFYNKPVGIKMLAGLLAHPNIDARCLANTFLYGKASGEKGAWKQVEQELRKYKLDETDRLVKELRDLLRKKREEETGARKGVAKK